MDPTMNRRFRAGRVLRHVRPQIGTSIDQPARLAGSGRRGRVTVTHTFIAFLKNQENAQARIVAEFRDITQIHRRNFRTSWTDCPIDNRKTSMTSSRRSPGCQTHKTRFSAMRS